MPVDAAVFRTHLATLPAEPATAFVADLWNARGWEVEHEEDRLVATPTPTAPTETLAVLAADSTTSPITEVDTVVTTTDPDQLNLPTNVDVVAPDDLFQLVKFGVEPDRGERLLSEHFDALPADIGIATETPVPEEPTTNSPTDSVANPEPDEPDRDDPEDPVQEVDTAASDTPDEGVDTENVAEIDDNPPGTPAETTEPTNSTIRTPSRRTLLLTSGAVVAGFGTAIATGVTTNAQPTVEAPGVTAEGVVDPTSLGQAHATGIAERSCALALDLTISDADESLRSYLSMALGLAADRTCRTRVSTSGEGAPGFLGEPPATAEFWSNGDTLLVNHDPGETDSFSEFRSPDGFVGTWKYWAWMVPFGGTLGSRPKGYFETVFDAIPTRLLERQAAADGPRYRVANDGRELTAPSSLNEPGATDVRDVSLDAVIYAQGVVRFFELRFAADLDGEPVEYHRTTEYAAFDETTVTRPETDG